MVSHHEEKLRGALGKDLGDSLVEILVDPRVGIVGDIAAVKDNVHPAHCLQLLQGALEIAAPGIAIRARLALRIADNANAENRRTLVLAHAIHAKHSNSQEKNC